MKAINYVFLLSFSSLLVGCGNDKRESESGFLPVKVKTMLVEPSIFEGGSRFSGTVEEENGTSLSFSVMGTVKNLRFGLGDRVTKGELLATLDSTSMWSSYVAAKATLEQAEDVHRRMKELHDKGSLAEVKWVEAQSQLQQARSMERLARKNLDDCRLYAPYSGVIAEKTMEVGQNVMPGVAVAKLVTADELKVKIAVPESEISDVKVGQEADIRVSALNGCQFTGVVVEKGVVANPLSRSYEVKMRIKDAPKGLMPGMVTEVVLRGADAEAQYIVPARVVQLDEENRSFVWVNKDGKAEKRVLTCGGFTANGVTVVSGLERGDEIIVEGQQKVCNGTELLIGGK